MQKNILQKIAASSLILFLLCMSQAVAAELVLEQPNRAALTFTVLLDTGGVDINGADMRIRFPKELTFLGYGEGTLTTWVERPHLEAPGVVHFAGIIPGGVSRSYDPLAPEKKALPLVQVRFSADKELTGTLSFSDIHIYKNDGAGGELVTEGRELQIVAVPHEAEETRMEERAFGPFVITLVPASEATGMRMLALFEAHSTAGIDHYEATLGGQTERVESPFRIEKSFVTRTLRIRAVDTNGQFVESSVRIPGSLPTGILIGVPLVLGILVIRVLFFRKKQTPFLHE